MWQSGHVVHTQLQLSVARDFDGWQLQQGLRMSELEKPKVIAVLVARFPASFAGRADVLVHTPGHGVAT